MKIRMNQSTMNVPWFANCRQNKYSTNGTKPNQDSRFPVEEKVSSRLSKLLDAFLNYDGYQWNTYSNTFQCLHGLLAPDNT